MRIAVLKAWSGKTNANIDAAFAPPMADDAPVSLSCPVPLELGDLHGHEFRGNQYESQHGVKWEKDKGDRTPITMVSIHDVIGEYDPGYSPEASAKHVVGLTGAIERSGKVTAMTAVDREGREGAKYRVTDGKHRLTVMRNMGVTTVGLQVHKPLPGGNIWDNPPQPKAQHVVTETHHHDAAVLASQGIRAGLKPRINQVDEFAPGRGLENQATYVSSPDANHGSFGNVRVHFDVPEQQLDLPAEQKQLGWQRDSAVSGLLQALASENGGVVRGNVPPERIKHIEVSEGDKWSKYSPAEYLSKYHEVTGPVRVLPTLDEYRKQLKQHQEELSLNDDKIEQTVGEYARADLKTKVLFANEIDDLKPKQMALSVPLELAGDLPGHPFRGNQYSDGADGPEHKTSSPEFKQWFKASAVVDDDGKPMVVYHGTSLDFNEFKNDDIDRRDEGYFGRGFYFTDSQSLASGYGNSYKKPELAEGGNVKPVYLSIQKPYYWKKGDEAVRPQSDDCATEEQYKREMNEWSAWFRKDLMRKGYDGVIVKKGDGVPAEYVAFYPEQVKSASGNRGKYDPKNPDITASLDIPLELGDLPGHPFRGNQWTSESFAPDTGGSYGSSSHEPVIPVISRSEHPLAQELINKQFIIGKRLVTILNVRPNGTLTVRYKNAEQSRDMEPTQVAAWARKQNTPAAHVLAKQVREIAAANPGISSTEKNRHVRMAEKAAGEQGLSQAHWAEAAKNALDESNQVERAIAHAKSRVPSVVSAEETVKHQRELADLQQKLIQNRVLARNLYTKAGERQNAATQDVKLKSDRAELQRLVNLGHLGPKIKSSTNLDVLQAAAKKASIVLVDGSSAREFGKAAEAYRRVMEQLKPLAQTDKPLASLIKLPVVLGYRMEYNAAKNKMEEYSSKMTVQRNREIAPPSPDAVARVPVAIPVPRRTSPERTDGQVRLFGTSTEYIAQQVAHDHPDKAVIRGKELLFDRARAAELAAALDRIAKPPAAADAYRPGHYKQERLQREAISNAASILARQVRSQVGPPVAAPSSVPQPFVIHGNTFAIKDVIKRAGGKWNPDKKQWHMPNQAAVEKVRAHTAKHNIRGVVMPTDKKLSLAGDLPGHPFRGNQYSDGTGQGQDEAHVTKTPTFKKWFGDSKVVDKEGNPRVLYHGTLSDSNVLRGKVGNRPGLHSEGIWFTSNPESASEYASFGTGGNVRAVYLNIKNPARVYQEELTHEHVEDLKSKGYDGAYDAQTGSWIAFDPNQIKSATGNRGTFDPKNPDITASLCVPIVLAGDLPGHPFRGNQYTDGSGSPEKLIDSARPQMVTAAQKVLDEWEQDSEGLSDDRGGGGVCDLIAQEIGSALVNKGFSIIDGGQDGDDHAYVIAHNGDQAFSVDISPDVYESGGGYNWKKREGVQLEPGDIAVDECNFVLDEMDPDERAAAREDWAKAHEDKTTPSESEDEQGEWTDHRLAKLPLTEDMSQSGFIRPDAKLIDVGISEAFLHSNTHSAAALGEDGVYEDDPKAVEALDEAMNQGFIRHSGNGDFELHKEPTVSQYAMLQDMAEDAVGRGNRARFEMSGVEGTRAGVPNTAYISANDPAEVRSIPDRIRAYYQTGKQPYVSPLRLSVDVDIELGDSEGHPFRGNQYGDGTGQESTNPDPVLTGNSGYWGNRHDNSQAMAGYAAKLMGVSGYKYADDWLAGARHAQREVVGMLEAIRNNTNGSPSTLYHGFADKKDTKWVVGEKLKLSLTATTGSSAEEAAGYGVRTDPKDQVGTPTVFEFPKGTPMAGYSKYNRDEEKEYGYRWREAIVAGEYEVVAVRQQVGLAWHGDDATATVVTLRATQLFDPDSKKWLNCNRTETKLSLDIPLELGDSEGHPFRGNQYGDGTSQGQVVPKPSERSQPSDYDLLHRRIPVKQSRRERKEPVADVPKPAADVPKPAADFLYNWQWSWPSQDKHPAEPSDDVVKFLGTCVPNAPIKVYRAGFGDKEKPQSMSAWTTDKDIAEALVDESGPVPGHENEVQRVLMDKIVRPDEILVAYDLLPKQYLKNQKDTIPTEVVVIGGDFAKHVKKVRAQSVTLSHDDLPQRIADAGLETDLNPTEAQRQSGHYRKGRVTVAGMGIAIESPLGSIRKGVLKDGTPWSTIMKAGHYGYVYKINGNWAPRSEADQDHVDIFLAPNPVNLGTVFVIDQTKPDNSFDECKCMVGYPSVEAAVQAYHDSYSEGWQGFADVIAMPIEQFKSWVEQGKTGEPAGLLKDGSTVPLVMPPALSRHDEDDDDEDDEDDDDDEWTTEPNVMGGRNIRNSKRQQAATYRNVFGGESQMGSDFETRPNIFGGVDVKGKLKFSLSVPIVLAGDLPGHEFRGNQYTTRHSSASGPEPNMKLFNKLPITKDYRKAGFIKPTGDLVDLSGGYKTGGRNVTHAQAFGGQNQMLKALTTGIIRYVPEYDEASVHIGKEPTEAQYDQLREIIKLHKGAVLVEVANSLGKWMAQPGFTNADDKIVPPGGRYARPDDAEDHVYDKGTDPDTVIDDLKRYYDGGSLRPKASLTAQFHVEASRGPLELAGDLPGHPFRGNQYSDGGTAVAEPPDTSSRDVPTAKAAWGKIMSMPTTDDWTSAGFIRPDGKLVDMNKGSARNSIDHNDLFPQSLCRLQEVIADGMLRINPDYNGIEIGKEPTDEQIAQLSKILRSRLHMGIAVNMHAGLGELKRPPEGDSNAFTAFYSNAPTQHRNYSETNSTVGEVLREIGRFYNKHRNDQEVRYESPLAAFLSLDVPIELAGDLPGHPFRGNQWVDVGEYKGRVVVAGTFDMSPEKTDAEARRLIPILAKVGAAWKKAVKKVDPKAKVEVRVFNPDHPAWQGKMLDKAWVEISGSGSKPNSSFGMSITLWPQADGNGIKIGDSGMPKYMQRKGIFSAGMKVLDSDPKFNLNGKMGVHHSSNDKAWQRIADKYGLNWKPWQEGKYVTLKDKDLPKFHKHVAKGPSKELSLAGDLPGHEFRGNQYTGGEVAYHGTSAKYAESIAKNGITLDHRNRAYASSRPRIALLFGKEKARGSLSEQVALIEIDRTAFPHLKNLTSGFLETKVAIPPAAIKSIKLYNLSDIEKMDNDKPLPEPIACSRQLDRLFICFLLPNKVKSKELSLAGDLPGHPFRGNQYAKTADDNDTLITKIPEYHDAYDEKPTDNMHAAFRQELAERQRNAMTRFLQGEEPLASSKVGLYTTYVMGDSNHSYITVKDGDRRPAPSGMHMGRHDPDLQEVLGIDEATYNKMSMPEKMKADATVQSTKYAPTQFASIQKDFWKPALSPMQSARLRQQRHPRTDAKLSSDVAIVLGDLVGHPFRGNQWTQSEYATQPRVFATKDDIEEHTESWGGDKKYHTWKDGLPQAGFNVQGRILTKAELPEVLYHATIAKSAVEGTNVLLGKNEIHGGALGGGGDTGVSLTQSRGDAELIARELKRRVLIGHDVIKTQADFEKMAREDEKIAGMMSGSLQPAVVQAMRGQDEKQVRAWNKQFNPDYTEEQVLKSIRSGMMDAHNMYLQCRESIAKGSWSNGVPQASPEGCDKIKNPILYTNRDAAEKLDPDDIGVVEVPTKNIPDNALVTSGSDDFLHEVRVYADVPLRESRTATKHKPDPNQAIAASLDLLNPDINMSMRERVIALAGNPYHDPVTGQFTHADVEAATTAAQQKNKEVFTEAKVDPDQVKRGVKSAFFEHMANRGELSQLATMANKARKRAAVTAEAQSAVVNVDQELTKAASGDTFRRRDAYHQLAKHHKVIADECDLRAKSARTSAREHESAGYGDHDEHIAKAAAAKEQAKHWKDLSKANRHAEEVARNVHVPLPTNIKASLDIPIELAGDLPGHEFRGNQYTGGGGGDKLSEHKVFDADTLKDVRVRHFATDVVRSKAIKSLLSKNHVTATKLMSLPVEYNQGFNGEVGYSDTRGVLYINWPRFDKLPPVAQRAAIAHEMSHAADHIAGGRKYDPYKEDDLDYWDRPSEQKAHHVQLEYLRDAGLPQKAAERELNGNRPLAKYKSMVHELANDVYGIKASLESGDVTLAQGSAAYVDGVPNVRQPNHFWCGACSAYAVGHGKFGRGPASLKEWADALGTTVEKSTNPFAIVKYLTKLGLRAVSREGMTIDDLKKALAVGHPVIVCLQDYSGVRDVSATFEYGHYLTIIECTPDFVIAQDSSIENALGVPGGSVPKSHEQHDVNVTAPGRVPITYVDFMKNWHDVTEDGVKLKQFGIEVSDPERPVERRIPITLAGDLPGHPFRGNQYTSGGATEARDTMHKLLLLRNPHALIPKDWQSFDKVAPGVGAEPKQDKYRNGEWIGSHCYARALAAARAGDGDLYIGTAVERTALDDLPKQNFEQYWKPGVGEAGMSHAWVVDKQGRVVDPTLGSERAADHYYYGVKVDPKDFEDDGKLSAAAGKLQVDAVTKNLEACDSAAQQREYDQWAANPNRKRANWERSIKASLIGT